MVVTAYLDSCSDGSRGCDAQALLAKVDHGLVAPLFGLHNVLVDLLQGQNKCTLSQTPLKYSEQGVSKWPAIECCVWV